MAQAKVSRWNMGQASLVTVLGAEAGLVRPRVPDPTRAGDDPIRLVDAAVRSVLVELRTASLPRPAVDEHVCLDRLFTLRHAEALPPGTRVLRIGPGTVVTPMARDLLRRQGITIHLGLPESLWSAAAGEWGFSIATGSEAGPIQALRRALVEDARSWLEVPSGLPSAAAWLLADTGRGVLLLTHEPEVVVWQACRVPGLRAASAHELADVHRAVRGLGINLLAIEPAGKSISWIKQLGLAFRQGGAPAAPEHLAVEDVTCGLPR